MNYSGVPNGTASFAVKAGTADSASFSLLSYGTVSSSYALFSKTSSTSSYVIPSGTGLTILRTNAAATQPEWAVARITEVVNPTAADSFKTVRVNSAGTAFEKVSMTGSAVQIIEATRTTKLHITTAMALAVTAPVKTEGGEVVTVSITPTSATSVLLVDATIHVSCDSNGSKMMISLFKDTDTDAVSTSWGTAVNNGDINTLTLHYRVAAGSTTARTYKIRAGSDTSNVTINGIADTLYFGGTLISSIRVAEIVG